MTRAEQIAANPDFPFLDAVDAQGVARFLGERGWLGRGESVAGVSKAGEGNMNLTLRVALAGGDRSSVILKQARPWVEKYDSIAAPWDRAAVEAAFYERVKEMDGVADLMPSLIASDAAARALLMDDLGDASDFTDVYAGGDLDPVALGRVADYARALHDATAGDPDTALANREMRVLNHQHIYEIPLAEENGLDLDAIALGLFAAASELRNDVAYVAKVKQTGTRYLADGRHLLHGDYFPGSWLRTGGLTVIDPEFCFFGDREFDLAVPVAHLALAGRPRDDADALLGRYGAPDLDQPLLSRYAAAEVMRRLIGVAQLPIPNDRIDRPALLRRSRGAMMSDSWIDLWT